MNTTNQHRNPSTSVPHYGGQPPYGNAPPPGLLLQRKKNSRSKNEIRLKFSYLIGIAGFLLAMLPGDIPSAAILIAMGFYALVGPKQCVQALSLLMISISLNANFFPAPAQISLIRWFVIFCCFLSVARLVGGKIPTVVITQVVLLVFLSVIAMISSFSPAISMMKLTTLGLGSVTCLAIFHTKVLSRDEALSWVYNLATVLTVASLPLIYSPLGYKEIYTIHGHDFGFIGMFNRPNELGIFLSMNLGWLIPKMLIAKRRSLVDLVLLGSVFTFIFLAKTRGPVLVVLVAFGLFFAVSLSSQAKWRKRATSILLNRITVLGVIAVAALLALESQVIIEKATAFMTKSEGNLLESISDRFLGIEIQFENLRKNPFFGIGFGIDSFPEAWINSGKIRYDPILKTIPVSASVEKGSAVMALLEENGLIGYVAILLAWGSFIPRILKHGDSMSLILFFAAMSVNLTEFVMCSVGQLGLYMWLMIGISLAPVKSESPTAYWLPVDQQRRR